MALLDFFNKRKPPTLPVPPERHYGLFSMSAGDVIISKPLYDVIVLHLRSGTQEARHALADQLEEVVRGMY